MPVPVHDSVFGCQGKWVYVLRMLHAPQLVSQLVISSLDMPGLTQHPAVRFLPEAVCTGGFLPAADVENV